MEHRLDLTPRLTIKIIVLYFEFYPTMSVPLPICRDSAREISARSKSTSIKLPLVRSAVPRFHVQIKHLQVVQRV
jgi:hypothetical protein